MAVNGPLKPFLRLLKSLAGIVPRRSIFARLTDFQMAQGDQGLRLPRVSSAIAGATSPAQARGNTASAGWTPTDAEMSEVDPTRDECELNGRR
jgi:hypothetical protein